MRTIVRNNKRGFTLVELMVALTILTISMMAMLDCLGRYLQFNMENVISTEAMRIAEQQMEVMRNSDFTSLAGGNANVVRTFRNKNVTFAVTWWVDVLSVNNRAVRVQVAWTFMNANHQHNATTIMSQGA
ncbi:MAG TPA: prepilin-type N-terminal cleavage/methylation domain-containing protein [Syntrophorhabdaceae bacterium]|nr:prepilin-type N-terminal cleavage/methylation domain-containing protein [Syntrophorhabdaceae bacterium]